MIIFRFNLKKLKLMVFRFDNISISTNITFFLKRKENSS